MINRIEFSALEGCSLQELHQCFVRAFGDYQVPMDLPVERFRSMLARNGFEATLSAGAFCDGQLVGFVFNGVRYYAGGKLAYDSGTAVLPKFRGQEIATRLMAFTMELLSQAGVYGYVLECIETNTKALSLYQKNGFRRTRYFTCWQTERRTLLTKTMDIQLQYQIKEGTPAELHEAQNILSSYPSWQNSDSAILAISTQMKYIKLTDDQGKTIGFAAWDPSSGSIARLATWDGDAVFRLLQHIACHSTAPRIRMVNVDTDDRLLPSALEGLGFSAYVRQIEMFKFLQER